MKAVVKLDPAAPEFFHRYLDRSAEEEPRTLFCDATGSPIFLTPFC